MSVIMRTLPQAVALLTAEDPDNQLKLSTLRKLVSRGEIPSVKVGNYRLVDMEILTAYLKTGSIKNRKG